VSPVMGLFWKSTLSTSETPWQVSRRRPGSAEGHVRLPRTGKGYPRSAAPKLEGSSPYSLAEGYLAAGLSRPPLLRSAAGRGPTSHMSRMNWTITAWCRLPKRRGEVQDQVATPDRKGRDQAESALTRLARTVLTHKCTLWHTAVLVKRSAVLYNPFCFFTIRACSSVHSRGGHDGYPPGKFIWSWSETLPLPMQQGDRKCLTAN
jgi:hypothetical protein